MWATLIFLFSLVGVGQSLWPISRQLQSGSTPLKLSRDFDIGVSFHSAPPDLLDAVSRTRKRLRNDAFERLVVGRSSADTHLVTHATSLEILIISLTDERSAHSIASEITKPIESRSESYSLSVPIHRQARLIANSTLGLFRGLATFEQLWYAMDQEKYLLSAPIEIVDEPAFVSEFFRPYVIKY